MKVLNYTTSYFAIFLLLLITIWAGIFYYAMLDEIYDSIDDGLDNQKGLILQKVTVDSTILHKTNFEESDYSITEINPAAASKFNDVYIDTMMYMQNEKDFEPVRLLKSVFRHQQKYYHLQVATSMVEEDDLVAELLYAMIWLYVGLVATILIINNLLLKRIWAPFYNLLAQLKNFSLQKPSKFTVKNTSNIDEFKLLDTTVQELLQNNIDAYTSQKQFIENASHELQTPLAISINKLEVLAESNNLSDEEIELLSSALHNLERLTRLNKSLLLLFKIENRLYYEKNELPLNPVIKKVVSDFADQLEYSHLEIDVIQEAQLTVNMNQDLAFILFTNLVKNAIVHNHAGGKIKILINNQSVSIQNTGSASLDQHQLFARFHHKPGAETTSTGLGLAIAKAIMDLYSFRINYSFHSNHRFELVFE